MTRPIDDASLPAYVDATAALLGLSLRAEHRAGVELQFTRLASLAQLVSEHPLAFTDEPAALFHPGTTK